MAIKFENYFELVSDCLDMYANDAHDICIYASVENARMIVKEIIGQDYVGEEILHIEYFNLDPYSADVVLINIDEHGGIWVEDALYQNDKFLMADADVIYTDVKYLDAVKEANGADGYECIAYIIGDNVPENKQITVLTDDNDKVSGFKYEDKKDGKCFSVEYCNCEPVDDIEGMLNMCKNILDAYFKFH